MLPVNVAMLQDMWDGTFQGLTTKMAYGAGRYEVKHVEFNAWFDTPPVYTMVGLYTVDAALSEAEISSITSKMYLGDDTLHACQTCPSNAISLQGSTSVANCTLGCPAGQFESVSVVSNDNLCQTCPANAVSLEGSTSVDACQCQADTYEETRVLNPSEASRTYSSVVSDHCYSQLHLLHYSAAWVAGTNTQGQWMEIDASEPMYILGVITQGRGNNIQQWVTEFRVEYRMGGSQGENIMLPGTFSLPDTPPSKSHLIASCFQHDTNLFYRLPNDNNVMSMSPINANRGSCAEHYSLGYFDTLIRWTSLKINTTTLRVDSGDSTFTSHFIGTIPFDFRHVGDCAGGGSKTGTMTVDLQGTPFAIEDFRDDLNCEFTGQNYVTRQCGQWSTAGWNSAMEMDCVNGQLCTIRCGGSFGWCFLTKGYLQLKVIDTDMMTQQCASYAGTDTEHAFASPIFARYMRIIPLHWVNKIAMRAALIVKSCSSCIATAVSFESSAAETACEFHAGSYKSTSEANTRAITRVPGRAQLSTFARRNLRLYAATAVFDQLEAQAL